MKKLSVLLLVTLFIIPFVSVPIAKAQAAKPFAPAVISDVLVLRPLGFAGTVLGTTTFLVSLPVTLSFRQRHQAENLLVKKPFRYTFKRPLGKM